MTGPEPAGPWSPRRYAVSPVLFAELARGGGGSEGARLLADAEYSRRLMMLWAVRRAAAQYGGDVDRRARAAWQALTEAQRRAPGTVRSLVGYPAVGPALLRTLHALTSGRPRAAGAAPHDSGGARGPGEPPLGAGEYCGAGVRAAADRGDPVPAAGAPDPLDALAVLAAAAVAATGVPARVDVALHDRRIVLPGLGAVRAADAADGSWAVVESGPSGAWVAVGGRRVAIGAAAGHLPPSQEDVWEPLRALGPSGGPGGTVLLDDIDSHTPVAHERSGRLSDAAWARWRQRLGAGWRLLHAEHPEVAAEADVVFRAAVPLTGSPGTSRSSSSPEAFGAVALSLADTPEGVALALAHELQHNKLSAVLHLFDLTAERPGESFYAPWREDPRPLVGLLQGTYAHLGVARFWHRRMVLRSAGPVSHEVQTQFARWRAAAAEAGATLAASGRLTRQGELFVAGMNEALAELGRVPLPSAAAAEGAARATAHRRRWTGRHAADAARGRRA